MKRRFLILLSTIFAIAAIGLVLIQITQTRRSAKMSDNLFNISVNNAIDEVFNQLEQMKVEDYVSEQERYKLVRYRRIDERQHQRAWEQQELKEILWHAGFRAVSLYGDYSLNAAREDNHRWHIAATRAEE